MFKSLLSRDVKKIVENLSLMIRESVARDKFEHQTKYI